MCKYFSKINLCATDLNLKTFNNRIDDLSQPHQIKFGRMESKQCAFFNSFFFSLQGVSSITCGTNGQWSGPAPTCIPISKL